MKRLSLAFAAIGLTAACGVFAASAASTDSSVVNVPQMPGGFEVGLQGYYLQPSTSNGFNGYTIIGNETVSTPPIITYDDKGVSPGYNWGWGANVGYIFPNTANDINLSYFHLDSNDTASAFQPGVDADIGETNSILTGKAETTIDQVDLTLGQAINVGSHLVLHPFAGLRYDDIDNEQTSNTYFPEGANYNLYSNDKTEGDFQGVGPLAGIDASYNVGMGVGIVAHADSAVLIGSQNAKDTYTIYYPSGSHQGEIDEQKVANANSTRAIVPVVDGKLGLDYTYLINNASNSDLSLEVGYQASHYFNATEIASVDADGTVNARIGLDGPYASLTFHA